MSGLILYTSDDGQTRLHLHVEAETIWLSQLEIAELFQTTKQNVSLHEKNIFADGELLPEATVKDSLTAATDGKHERYVRFDTQRREAERIEADMDDLKEIEQFALGLPGVEGLLPTKPEIHACIRRGMAGSVICARGACTIAVVSPVGAAGQAARPANPQVVRRPGVGHHQAGFGAVADPPDGCCAPLGGPFAVLGVGVASDGSPRGLGQASRLSNRPLDIYPWAENRPVTDFELTHDR